jgi:glutamate racemase
VADAPIGIFDSGYGGLTVARAVLDQLPHESIAYFGDTARAPYGPRPIAESREFALECLDRLVEHGVKVLVIACNTASAAVLHDARERYDVPVVEVIRPAVRRAARATRNHRVGVISTRGTHQSGAYVDAFAAAPHLEVTSVACPRFVELVESGITSGQDVIDVARDYLRPLVDRDVDTLVLGCTHYPLLTGAISYVMGDGVTLVSSADETAKDVYRILADTDALRPAHLPPPSHGFTTTGDATEFTRLARRFLGPEVGADSDAVFGNAVVRSVAATAPDTTPSAAVR